jgi:hypothetical protein
MIGNALFRNINLLDELRDHVACSFSSESDSLRATGIPPMVSILNNMRELKEQYQTLARAQAEASQETVLGVVRELERRAIGAGTVTFEGLETMIMSCLRTAGVMDAVQLVSNPPSNAGLTAPTAPVPNRLYTWGGRLSRLPETFRLPDGSPLQAWQYWCCGDPNLGYPPLRQCQPADVCDKSTRTRWSDLVYLMKQLESRANDLGHDMSQIDVQRSITIYDEVKDAIQLPPRTGNNRARRSGQLAWITVSTELRKLSRRSNTQ